MSGTLHHCILVPQGEVRRRGSHFSLQEKLEAWLETCGLCGCEWGGCEWGGIHDMCESHNQLKIHYYTLTSSHPHTLTHTPIPTLPSHASSGSNYTNWKGFPHLLLSVVHFAKWLPSFLHSLQPSWPPQTVSASLHAGAV